jgi:hypothetical protein
MLKNLIIGAGIIQKRSRDAYRWTTTFSMFYLVISEQVVVMYYGVTSCRPAWDLILRQFPLIS